MSDGHVGASSSEEEVGSPRSRASADTAFCAAHEAPGHSRKLLAKMRLRN